MDHKNPSLADLLALNIERSLNHFVPVATVRGDSWDGIVGKPKKSLVHAIRVAAKVLNDLP
jgi:hypothetical protein